MFDMRTLALIALGIVLGIYVVPMVLGALGGGGRRRSAASPAVA